MAPRFDDEMVVCETSSVIFARRRPGGPQRSPWEAKAAWRLSRGRIGLTRLDWAFMTALFVIFVLNMMDITITLYHIGNVGWDAEGNPLVKGVAEGGGAWLAVVLKVLIISTAVYVMWRLFRATVVALDHARSDEARRRAHFVFRSQMIATSVLLALYTWIIQNNVRIVWF